MCTSFTVFHYDRYDRYAGTIPWMSLLRTCCLNKFRTTVSAQRCLALPTATPGRCKTKHGHRPVGQLKRCEKHDVTEYDTTWHETTGHGTDWDRKEKEDIMCVRFTQADT